MSTPLPRPAAREADDRLPGMSWRRRLLMVVLAVAMGWAVVTTMIDPPGGIKRNPPARADAPVCASGQTQGCVGGTATVIAPPASAPGP